jgi:polyhydroxyalkanoate synthesis regulator phasin
MASQNQQAQNGDWAQAQTCFAVVALKLRTKEMKRLQEGNGSLQQQQQKPPVSTAIKTARKGRGCAAESGISAVQTFLLSDEGAVRQKVVQKLQKEVDSMREAVGACISTPNGVGMVYLGLL